MAISIDWGSRIITVPQGDLTLISGTLYELDTNWFRLALKDLEDSAEGMVNPDTHRHATEVVISGVTYARFFELINGYTVTFDPNDPYTVRLSGTNNNIADVMSPGHHHTSLLSANSAGLVVITGGGVTPPTAQQVADAVWNDTLIQHASAGSTGEALAAAAVATPDVLDGVVETGTSVREALRLLLASQVGKLSGADGTEITIRDINDLVDRIVATVDESGNRLAVVTDAT